MNRSLKYQITQKSYLAEEDYALVHGQQVGDEEQTFLQRWDAKCYTSYWPNNNHNSIHTVYTSFAPKFHRSTKLPIIDYPTTWSLKLLKDTLVIQGNSKTTNKPSTMVLKQPIWILPPINYNFKTPYTKTKFSDPRFKSYLETNVNKLLAALMTSKWQF